MYLGSAGFCGENKGYIITWEYCLSPCYNIDMVRNIHIKIYVFYCD